MKRQELINSTRKVLGRIQEECEPNSAVPEDIQAELLELTRNGRFIQEDAIADGIDAFLVAASISDDGRSINWLDELFSLDGSLNDVPGTPTPKSLGLAVDFEEDLDELLHLGDEELQVLGESVLRGEKIYTLRFDSSDGNGSIMDRLEQSCTVISYRRNHVAERVAFLVSIPVETGIAAIIKDSPGSPTRVRERDGTPLLRPAQHIGIARELDSVNEKIEINDIELLRLYIDELAATTDLPWLQEFVVQLSSVTARMFEHSIKETLRRVQDFVESKVESPKARIEISLKETDFKLSSVVSTLVEEFLGTILAAVAVMEIGETLPLDVSAHASGSIAEIRVTVDGTVPDSIRKLSESAYLCEAVERLERILGAEVTLWPEKRPELFLSFTIAPDPRLIQVMIVEDEGIRKSIPVAPIERTFEIGSEILHVDSFGKVLVKTGNLFLPVVSSSGASLTTETAVGKTCILFRKVSGVIAVTVGQIERTEMALRSNTGSGEVTIVHTGELLPFVVPE